MMSEHFDLDDDDECEDSALNTSQNMTNAMVSLVDATAHAVLPLIATEAAHALIAEMLAETVFVAFLRVLDHGGDVMEADPTTHDPQEALSFLTQVLTNVAEKVGDRELIEQSHPGTTPFAVTIQLLRRDPPAESKKETP